MTLVLPPCFALRGEMTWDNPGAFVSGGQSVFNSEPLTRRTDGGGGWRASIRGLQLNTAALQQTWEALLLRWNLGDTKIVVPRQGFRLRADFAGSLADTAWSDDTPFDDDTLFAGGAGFGVLADGIDLRATELDVILPPGAALRGGEPFTLVGATYGPRLYGVAGVTNVAADPGGDRVTILFGPPAREAYAADADVDFELPRCTMKAVIDTTEGAYPAYGRSRFAVANMTFVETWA